MLSWFHQVFFLWRVTVLIKRRWMVASKVRAPPAGTVLVPPCEKRRAGELDMPGRAAQTLRFSMTTCPSLPQAEVTGYPEGTSGRDRQQRAGQAASLSHHEVLSTPSSSSTAGGCAAEGNPSALAAVVGRVAPRKQRRDPRRPRAGLQRFPRSGLLRSHAVAAAWGQYATLLAALRFTGGPGKNPLASQGNEISVGGYGAATSRAWAAWVSDT